MEIRLSYKKQGRVKAVTRPLCIYGDYAMVLFLDCFDKGLNSALVDSIY